MPSNPTLTPTIRADMVEMVSIGAYTYLLEYTSGLFPDHKATEIQSLVLDGIADALRKYEKAIGKPLVESLAFTLLDHKEIT